MTQHQTPAEMAEEIKRLRDEIERPQLQGGMDNEELRESWEKKLPGVVPTEREMTAFALGVEVGNVGSRVYFAERNSARDAWRRRVKECERLQAEIDRLRARAESAQQDKAAHPMQPLVCDEHGVTRFRRNKVVDHLLEWARPKGMGLNELRAVGFDDDEWQQFAQLIGYSLSGWGTLSFVDDAAWDRAQKLAEPSAPRLMQDEPGTGAQGLSRSLAGKPDARRVVREAMAAEMDRRELKAWMTRQDAEDVVRTVLAAAPEAPEARKPLTEAQRKELFAKYLLYTTPQGGELYDVELLADDIERAHGITGEAS